MTLQELIDRLKKADPARVIPHGFHDPHSYRGFYHDLAFQPKDNVTVAEMLADAESAMGRTFKGYKGGKYEMGPYTEVWLAEFGCCGEQIGPRLLEYTLNEQNTKITGPCGPMEKTHE